MKTFFINDLIQFYCLRHVSNNQVFIIREDLYMQFYGIFSSIRISSLVEPTVPASERTQTHPLDRAAIKIFINF